MSTQDFYASLPVLTHFLDLANPRCYADAPADWYVLITDVVGSTQAITQGKYKEVNLLGASSIIAAVNAVAPFELPFVFGGDGASFLVPPAYFHAAREALLKVRQIAQQSFGMELRVGAVTVAAAATQYPLKVAKFQLTPTYCQASFIGGGMTYATDLIKAEAVYQVTQATSVGKADLSGLECRWQDLPSRHGQTLSLIVSVMPSAQRVNEQVYREVLQQIQQICGTAADYHPVDITKLKLSFNARRLSAELKARSRPGWWHRAIYLLKMLAENLLGACLMRQQITAGDVNWGGYKEAVCAASDYQKIDDVLRMVISSSPQQTVRLVQYLERRLKAGQLTYGIHISDRALMTCLILDRRDRHFHLIDGADGGYALAAKMLKAQLHQKAQNWQTYATLAKRRQRLRSRHPEIVVQDQSEGARP
ncbi:MAG: DUF3095 domain-containing protein [Leptolyngbya sp. SIO4C1]|nr:DUF3095 domain-containing protein [Leptolyngbya sp. SIO4C1]